MWNLASRFWIDDMARTIYTRGVTSDRPTKVTQIPGRGLLHCSVAKKVVSMFEREKYELLHTPPLRTRCITEADLDGEALIH